jgi:CspA family cold shock protein
MGAKFSSEGESAPRPGDDGLHIGQDARPEVPLEHDVDVIEIAGAIKWFDVAKGFGFIVPDDGRPDVLLDVTCLRRVGYQTA